LSKTANFYLPLYLAPPLQVTSFEFSPRILNSDKLAPYGTDGRRFASDGPCQLQSHV